MTASGAPSDRGGTRILRRFLIAALLAVGLAPVVPGADADSFGAARYDPTTDSLVVTILYGGTNPNHRFTLKWGTCTKPGNGEVSGIAADVLDSQWDDTALHDYSESVYLGLGDMPCRPAEVTLHTAPRFFYTVFVPPAPSAH